MSLASGVSLHLHSPSSPRPLPLEIYATHELVQLVDTHSSKSYPTFSVAAVTLGHDSYWQTLPPDTLEQTRPARCLALSLFPHEFSTDVEVFLLEAGSAGTAKALVAEMRRLVGVAEENDCRDGPSTSSVISELTKDSEDEVGRWGCWKGTRIKHNVTNKPHSA